MTMYRLNESGNYEELLEMQDLFNRGQSLAIDTKEYNERYSRLFPSRQKPGLSWPMRLLAGCVVSLLIGVLLGLLVGCEPKPEPSPLGPQAAETRTGVPLEPIGETATERQALLRILSVRAATPSPLAASYEHTCGSGFTFGICAACWSNKSAARDSIPPTLGGWSGSFWFWSLPTLD